MTLQMDVPFFPMSVLWVVPVLAGTAEIFGQVGVLAEFGMLRTPQAGKAL